MKLSDKRKIANQIDQIIQWLPGVKQVYGVIGYRYVMATPYGDLLIGNDFDKDQLGSTIYSVFCRFIDGREVNPNNPYLHSPYTNKYNLDLFFDDPDLIEKAIHHLTII